MQIYRGTGSSGGVAIGKAMVIYSSFSQFTRISLTSDEEVEQEVKRVEAARELAREQIDESEKQAGSLLTNEVREILSSHRLFLEDKQLIPATLEKIKEQKINAEWALFDVIETIKDQFSKIQDPYLRSRFDDVRQTGERVMNNLQNKPRLDISKLRDPVIIFCHDISPADAYNLTEGKIMGIVSELGGQISHSSIIARALGIPAVVGVEGITSKIYDNSSVIVDGGTGEIIHNPDAMMRQEKEEKKKRLQFFQSKLKNLVSKECELADGRKYELAANLDLLGELEQIKSLNLPSIGLIRTEFLFLDNSRPPNEDEQYRTFKKIADELATKPITIRTWDLGADKVARFFPAYPNESNPALGLRAIRMCLKQPDFFREQIRAIIRVAQDSPVRLMIPMITNVDEIVKVRRMVSREQKKMNLRPPNLKIGCMIETPAAVMIIDEILDVADFISIGTNDLVQYALAIDRMNEHVAHMYSPFHPAVLRMLEKVISRANEMNIPVAVCGEMAADPFFQMFLLGVGKVTFSMTPNRILMTKEFLRKIDEVTCKKVAFRFLSKRTVQESNLFLKELHNKYYQNIMI